MGTFTVPIQVGDSNGRAFVDIQALVDTGSTYTSIPTGILSGLGVEVIERHPFELADESKWSTVLVRRQFVWMDVNAPL